MPVGGSMNGMIEFIVGNSLPTSLSLLLNVGLILAIYFHFIPAMRERQDLIEQIKESDDLKNSVTDSFANIEEAIAGLSSAEHIEKQIKEYANFDNESRAIQAAKLESMLERLAKEMKGNEVAESLLRDIKADFSQRGSDLNVQLQLLQSAVNEIKATCVSISEKQSSINGALMISGADSLNKRLK